MRKRLTFHDLKWGRAMVQISTDQWNTWQVKLHAPYRDPAPISLELTVTDRVTGRVLHHRERRFGRRELKIARKEYWTIVNAYLIRPREQVTEHQRTAAIVAVDHPPSTDR